VPAAIAGVRGEDSEARGDRAAAQLEDQLVAGQQGAGAAVAGQLEELLVVPVEAGGQFAGRWLGRFGQVQRAR
jgi:hypothetical protein